MLYEQLKLNADGMIPAIVQEEKSNKVLMMAYMNEESLKLTIETGYTWFYSRSRKELWNKGATSGNKQLVKSVSYDCDGDCLLIVVEQTGAACHTGEKSCFFRQLYNKTEEKQEITLANILDLLYGIVKERKENPAEGSYTNYLFDKGLDKILKKIGEECAETIIAAKNQDKQEIIYEVSDYIYHLTVLLLQQNITYDEIAAELYKRFKA